MVLNHRPPSPPMASYIVLNTCPDCDEYCSDPQLDLMFDFPFTCLNCESKRWCRAEGCSQEINSEEDYCFNHSQVCARSFCTNRISAYQTKCSSCQLKCAHDFYCSRTIEKVGDTYCVKHTLTSQTPTRCWGGNYSWASRTIPCYSQVVTNDGYCYLHENKCVECEQRTSGSYCSAHDNSQCQVNDCYEPTPNSRQSNYYIFCSEHAKLYGNSLSNYQQVQQQEKIKQREQTEQNQLKALVQQRTSLANPQEVIRISAWWNNNLATVVNNYWVFFLVYDKEDNKVRVFPANANENKWGTASRSQHSSLTSAQSEAQWLREKLKYDSNPILVIRPSDSYVSFSEIVGEPYVKIDLNASISDFKPLDIAWVEKKRGLIEYHHVGVYIGNSEIVHLSGDNKGVCKVSWSTFLEGTKRQYLYRYHPIIPFKNYKQIIGQLVWAKDNQYGEGSYNLKNRNCEHFANMAVLGINYSQQIAEKGHLLQNGSAAWRGAATGAGVVSTVGYTILGAAFVPITGGASILIGAGLATASATTTAIIIDDTFNNADVLEINNGKSSIKLTEELSESNNKLGRKWDSETSQWEARVEQAIPSRIDNCVIM